MSNYTAVSFFSPEICIVPHTSNESQYLGHPVTIEQFADGHPVALYRDDDTGEYRAELRPFGEVTKRFIEGPEHQPDTVDITPTWKTTMQILAMVLENGTDEGKRMARDELDRVAGLLDASSWVPPTLDDPDNPGIDAADYREPESRREYEVTIDWGEEGNERGCYDFATKAERAAFIEGARECEGWLEFEIVEQRPIPAKRPPTTCPECGTCLIDVGEVAPDDDCTYTVAGRCTRCDAEWLEVYGLIEVHQTGNSNHQHRTNNQPPQETANA